MKKVLQIFALTTIYIPCAFANDYFRAPYIGIEVIQTNQDFKTAYGKDIFKKILKITVFLLALISPIILVLKEVMSFNPKEVKTLA